MAGDPYCGKCHTWMYPMQGVAQETVWLCDCPVGKEEIGKDPNCHNANHEHYDPQSPIVLSQKAEREGVEEASSGFVARDGPTDRPGSEFADHPYHVAVFDNGTGEMLGWRPLREPKIDEETRAELDAILEEANEKVED